MMKWFRKYQYQMTIGLAATMILYIFFQLGAEFFFTKGSTGEALVEVDGEKITVQNFLSHYHRVLEQTTGGKKPDAQTEQSVRENTVRDMVQSIVFAREAKRYGIQVPDRQVAISLTQETAFQEKGVFS